MVRIGVLGHIVEDTCIYVQDRARFEGFKSSFSIDDAIAFATKEDPKLGEIAEIHTSLGGTGLNWAQYLVSDHEVHLIGIQGDSTKDTYAKTLLEKLEVNIDKVKSYAARVFLVFV